MQLLPPVRRPTGQRGSGVGVAAGPNVCPLHRGGGRTDQITDLFEEWPAEESSKISAKFILDSLTPPVMLN